MEDSKKAKFVSVRIENFLDNSDSIAIEINFLGSCHMAAKHPNAGARYGNYSEVYYNLKRQGSDKILTLTFSGPTLMDLKKPNISSIKKEAKEILNDLIPNIHLLGEKISISIQGHSRGGIVANKIQRWLTLSSNPLKDMIKLKGLVLADPYAGPINRRVSKASDNLDDSNLDVPTSKVAVYTTAEKRFRDPAQSLRSNVIVFTDTSHDRTRYIAKYVFDSHYRGKVYICADPNNQLTKMYRAVGKKPTESEQKYIDTWFEKTLEPVSEKNLKDILTGTGKYKNFAYSKIASDGRKKLFYAAMAMISKEKVKKFLESNHRNSMWKMVEGVLRSLGIA